MSKVEVGFQVVKGKGRSATNDGEERQVRWFKRRLYRIVSNGIASC